MSRMDSVALLFVYQPSIPFFLIRPFLLSPVQPRPVGLLGEPKEQVQSDCERGFVEEMQVRTSAAQRSAAVDAR